MCISSGDLNTKRHPRIVLILDHDETFAISDKKSNGEYNIQKDGSIHARIMDKEKLCRVIELAILFGVPIHVVTARADIPGDRQVVEGIIDSVNGFHVGLGGFKREHIHFAGSKMNGEYKQIVTKLEIIENIRKKTYPHLPKEAFLFVDDMLKYLDGVKQAGYLTYQANPETKEHFDLIEEFILNQGKFYTTQPMLFKRVIAAIPSEKDELPQGVSPELMQDGVNALRRALK